jgi:uncharacterized protein YegP (UPF0339 family)
VATTACVATALLAAERLPSQEKGIQLKFEIRKTTSKSQPYYWRIVAGNGQVLASSETYVQKQSCLDAIAVVKKNAAAAPVDDTTLVAARH